jgi:hypothetical protein
MPHAMRLLRPVRRRRPGHFFAARQQRTTGPDPLVLLEEGGLQGRIRRMSVGRASGQKPATVKTHGSHGEPGGTRTHGPKIKSLVLYQLSYGLTRAGLNDRLGGGSSLGPCRARVRPTGPWRNARSLDYPPALDSPNRAPNDLAHDPPFDRASRCRPRHDSRPGGTGGSHHGHAPDLDRNDRGLSPDRHPPGHAAA